MLSDPDYKKIRPSLKELTFSHQKAEFHKKNSPSHIFTMTTGDISETGFCEKFFI